MILITYTWLSIKKVIFKIALLAHKSLMGIAPSHLQELFCYTHFGREPKLTVPYFHSSYGQRSFSCAAPRLYNKLPMYVKSSNSLFKFKKILKTYLFCMNDYELNKLYKV